ncbi:MAG: anti-sigma factor RsbA family regulatory protein [Acidimicrobiales bacterium]
MIHNQTSTLTTLASRGGFRHEVLLYKGSRGFAGSVLPFIRSGLESGDRVVAAISDEKTAYVRDVLGDAADQIVFIDESTYGRNPNRFIPVWRSWVSKHVDNDRRLRGISEPIGIGRTPAEREERSRHEALLNLAFEDSSPWQLLCSYDIDSLDEDDLLHVRTHHPYVRTDDRAAVNESYSRWTPSLNGPLPQPESTLFEMAFDESTMRQIRALVARDGRSLGLADARVSDLALAVNELTTNSIRHGKGRGEVRWWQQDGWMICEVRDSGRINDIWAGRVAPSLEASGGRGLWLVNQLCDLVQIRSDDAGGTVRVSMSLPAVPTRRQPPAQA